MDEGVTVSSGVLVDPCPDFFVAWYEAIENGWLRLAGDGPAEAPPQELEPWQLTDQALLAELEATQQRLSRLQGCWLALLADVEKREATLKLAGLPTSSWLVDRNTHSARAAREEVRLAAQLDAQPIVADALGQGCLSVEQARVIAHGLDRLPDELDGAQRREVAAQLVEFGQQFGPYGLARLVNRAVEVVAPEVVEDADRRAVERTEREQRRARYVTWRKDLDGSLVLSGRLDAVSGEKLVGVLTAVGANVRKTAALAGQEISRAQAAADALVRLVDHYAGCTKLPRRGADRPRILVGLDHDVLCGQLGTGTMLNTGEQISAQQARVLACDAGILPMVMGGDSVPLDVGREKRLFTGHLRSLLIARDQGCAFPGCAAGPAECDAHHRKPWSAGGETSLSNGVLQCTFHHHVVEPVPGASPETQWQIRLDARGYPEFGAPEGVGAPPGQRRWRQHQRYQTMPRPNRP
ncbi:DUF222 domain-containing protein [Propionicimonas sp.]|uniref:HNH endonuclease signature motif containing protein n=1 Tax=Propionicimonas sp. TaxID=1955623 RepID=UPI0039E21C5C